MAKWSGLIFIAVFALLTAGLAVADIIKPDAEESLLENRPLAQMPAATVSSVVNGRWALAYEEYVNDQFIGRDGWIDIKSRAEFLLGKLENNGVVYGADGKMFEKYTALDEDRLERNIGYVERFCEKYDIPVTVAMVPNSYMVYPDALPAGLPKIDQRPYLEEMNGRFRAAGAQSVELLPALLRDSDELLFYRTDHHWTTRGAYSAYEAWCETTGREAVPLESLEAYEEQDFYGTYYSKTKLFNAQPDTIVWYKITIDSMEFGEHTSNVLYNSKMFDTRDKYAVFLHGNNGVSVIRCREADDPKRLLVIKDSYANCIVPFLTAHFDEIVVVDPRFLPDDLSVIISNYYCEEVLILYNFMNFAADVSVSELIY